MAKKRAAAKKAPSAEKSVMEEALFDPTPAKALRMVDTSAKLRAELERAVTMAAIKAVRKVMKDHGISLTMAQAMVLTSNWFGE